MYIYVCVYGHHGEQSIDQPGKVANPARGQLGKENKHFPVPVRASEFGRSRRLAAARSPSYIDTINTI